MKRTLIFVENKLITQSMKKQLFICTTLMLALMACGGEKKEETTNDEVKDTTKTEEAKVEEETPAVMPDSATMMQNWMAYMTPGEMHKMLAKYDGKFTAEVTMWMDASAPPAKSKGMAENKMILGGRYQESKFKGEFEGMPFEGQNIIGYDNSKKKFFTTWIDNMGSGIMTYEGDWDAEKKAVFFTGSMVDPMTGFECEMRETFTLVDDNTQLMESWCKTPDGKEYKSMEIKYTRKK
jgi:hypothetical protein